jgi:hypothetical protein
MPHSNWHKICLFHGCFSVIFGMVEDLLKQREVMLPPNGKSMMSQRDGKRGFPEQGND